MAHGRNKYEQIIEAIFQGRYNEGAETIPFDRTEIDDVSSLLGFVAPKNFGDVIYSFRYRNPLPDSIRSKAPEGREWVIRPTGRSSYAFVLVAEANITPSARLVETKIPDATPGIIVRYALNDEQALLARIRYNRLIDIFTGLTCYSLQNHLRTAVPGMGQVETDELYIGLDKRGAHYALPVQAKGVRDRIGIVQIEQDFAVCGHKLPGLICRPIAAQLMSGEVIALFEFEHDGDDIRVAAERHYRLVRPEEPTNEELEIYRRRQEG